MRLTAAQFDEQERSNRLAMTLVGMSNVGKSYWSRALEGAGWRRIWTDGQLHQQLQQASVLEDATDEGLARWLGMPYEEGFAAREQRLLDLEAELFWETVRELGTREPGNVAVDPGGSFIYAGPELCEAFRAHSLMIYLETTPTARQEMFERFLQHPKALLWHGAFVQHPEESTHDALARCYPKLLEERAQTYARYADVVIPFHSLPRDGNVAQFLEEVRSRL